jgi:hemolysin III
MPFVIYFTMGWLILLVLKPLLAVLPTAGFVWLVTGGLLYTAGVGFFAFDTRYPWMHGAWHLFVLAGSISHYVAILFYV